MEGPTYKGREGREKREREVPPGYYGFPPGPRGARIVTAYRINRQTRLTSHKFLRRTKCEKLIATKRVCRKKRVNSGQKA